MCRFNLKLTTCCCLFELLNKLINNFTCDWWLNNLFIRRAIFLIRGSSMILSLCLCVCECVWVCLCIWFSHFVLLSFIFMVNLFFQTISLFSHSAIFLHLHSDISCKCKWEAYGLRGLVITRWKLIERRRWCYEFTFSSYWYAFVFLSPSLTVF